MNYNSTHCELWWPYGSETRQFSCICFLGFCMQVMTGRTEKKKKKTLPFDL